MNLTVVLFLLERSPTAEGLSAILRKMEDRTYGPTFSLVSPEPVLQKKHKTFVRHTLHGLLSLTLDSRVVSSIMKDEDRNIPRVHTSRVGDLVTEYHAVVIQGVQISDVLVHQLESAISPLASVSQGTTIQGFKPEEKPDVSEGTHMSETNLVALQSAYKHFAPKREPAPVV